MDFQEELHLIATFILFVRFTISFMEFQECHVSHHFPDHIEKDTMMNARILSIEFNTLPNNFCVKLSFATVPIFSLIYRNPRSMRFQQSLLLQKQRAEQEDQASSVNRRLSPLLSQVNGTYSATKV